MSQGSQYVAADGAPLGHAPAGACCHQRAVITGAAGPLGSFITAIGQAQSGIPYMVGPYDSNSRIFPKAVLMQVEGGQTGSVYVTYDGHDTALGDVSATLGVACIPNASGYVRIPADCNPTAGANALGLIRVLASAGTINVQCVFEF